MDVGHHRAVLPPLGDEIATAQLQPVAAGGDSYDVGVGAGAGPAAAGLPPGDLSRTFLVFHKSQHRYVLTQAGEEVAGISRRLADALHGRKVCQTDHHDHIRRSAREAVSAAVGAALPGGLSSPPGARRITSPLPSGGGVGATAGLLAGTFRQVRQAFVVGVLAQLSRDAWTEAAVAEETVAALPPALVGDAANGPGRCREGAASILRHASRLGALLEAPAACLGGSNYEAAAAIGGGGAIPGAIPGEVGVVWDHWWRGVSRLFRLSIDGAAAVARGLDASLDAGGAGAVASRTEWLGALCTYAVALDTLCAAAAALGPWVPAEGTSPGGGGGYGGHAAAKPAAPPPSPRTQEVAIARARLPLLPRPAALAARLAAARGRAAAGTFGGHGPPPPGSVEALCKSEYHSLAAALAWAEGAAASARGGAWGPAPPAAAAVSSAVADLSPLGSFVYRLFLHHLQEAAGHLGVVLVDAASAIPGGEAGPGPGVGVGAGAGGMATTVHAARAIPVLASVAAPAGGPGSGSLVEMDAAAMAATGQLMSSMLKPNAPPPRESATYNATPRPAGGIDIQTAVAAAAIDSLQVLEFWLRREPDGGLTRAAAARAAEVVASVANLACHTPNLYPGGATLQQMCTLHSEALQVGDAGGVVLALAGGGGAGDAAPLARAHEALLLSIGFLTDRLYAELAAVAARLWAADPPKSWDPPASPAAASAGGKAVIRQLLQPIVDTTSVLDNRTKVALVPAAAAAAVHALLDLLAAEGRGISRKVVAQLQVDFAKIRECVYSAGRGGGAVRDSRKSLASCLEGPMAPLFGRADAVLEVLSAKGKGGGGGGAPEGGEGAGAAAGSAGGRGGLSGRLPDAAVWQKLRK